MIVTVDGDAALYEPGVCPICGEEDCLDHVPAAPAANGRPASDADLTCSVCGLEACEDPEHRPPPEARRGAAHTTKRDPAADLAARREVRTGQEMERERARREARRRLDAEARGPVVRPEFHTVRDRLARPVADARWRIEGWQPLDARVITAAQYKTGKTTLVGNLCRSLVDGDPFLNSAPVAAIDGRVTVIDTEMPDRRLDDWMRDQRIVRDDQVVIVSMRGKVGSFDIRIPEVRTAWAQWLRELETAYLIVDCLKPILDGLNINEHCDTGLFLVPFDALLEEAGIPEANIVQHMGHGGERSRGDSRLRDWPDVEWRLVRKDDDPRSQRFVSAYGRDVDVPEGQLTFESWSKRLTLTGGSRRELVAGEALDAVLAVLTSSAPMSKRAIEVACEAAGCKVGRDAIRAAVAAGISRGVLTAAVGPRNAILVERVRA